MTPSIHHPRLATLLLLVWLCPALHAETPPAGHVDALSKHPPERISAAPGNDGTRRWTVRHAGSVRLIGSLRKIPATAEARVVIAAGGKEVWSRNLPPGDGIRHGIDVACLDLAKDSGIEVRVEATKDSVAVEAAFEVSPEPFLTRWSAGLTRGYPQWSEAETRTLRDKGQGILRTIREASEARRGKVSIPPGDYLFHARWSQASTLRNLADLEIEAAGVTFWFEPPLIHALLFEDCHNVTVRGLTIDFTIPCWFQAKVTAVDRNAGTVAAAIMPGYEPRDAEGKPETSGNRALMFYGAEGRFINHRHSPGTWNLSDDGKSLVCGNIGRSGIPAPLQPGDHVVGTLRTGAALRSVQCSGMRFEGVNIWSSPGMAVYEGGGAGGNIYRTVRATRRPATNRLQAFGADIFHLAGTDRGPTLDRCELAYGADDNLNIHGSFGRVVKRDRERHYFLEGAYSAGDTLGFHHERSLEPLGRAKVVSVSPAPGGPTLPLGEKHVVKGETLVELDTTLDLPPLSLVVMDGKRSAAGFVVRDCWLHDNFQRTLINGAPGGRIENNTLQNTGEGLIIQFETWGPWMEGPFASDLLIRGNRFIDSPPDRAVIHVSMHPPGGGSDTRRFNARPVANLTIEDNCFSRTTATPLVIHNVAGLRIRSNSLDHPADAPAVRGLANSSDRNWLYAQDCSDVALDGNLTPERSPGRDDRQEGSPQR